VPKLPVVAPPMAQGLFFNGLSPLEIQSIKFLRTPEIEWLYSGVTKITPSDFLILSFNFMISSGVPESSISWLKGGHFQYQEFQILYFHPRSFLFLSGELYYRTFFLGYLQFRLF
jgi:hypothetical protein